MNFYLKQICNQTIQNINNIKLQGAHLLKTHQRPFLSLSSCSAVCSLLSQKAAHTRENRNLYTPHSVHVTIYIVRVLNLQEMEGSIHVCRHIHLMAALLTFIKSTPSYIISSAYSFSACIATLSIHTYLSLKLITLILVLAFLVSSFNLIGQCKKSIDIVELSGMTLDFNSN